MNWVDVIVLIVLFIGLVKGLTNGFVRGLFGLAALVLGIMLAAGNYERVNELVMSRLPMSAEMQMILSFLIVFVVVLILVSIVGRIISKALKVASLGWLDRLAGGALGLFMSCLFVGVVLLLVVMAGFEGVTGVRRSTVAPTVISVIDVTVKFAPEAAREKIDEHYLKLRLEWEKARQEPPEEEEGEEGEEEHVVLPAPTAAGASDQRPHAFLEGSRS